MLCENRYDSLCGTKFVSTTPILFHPHRSKTTIPRFQLVRCSSVTFCRIAQNGRYVCVPQQRTVKAFHFCNLAKHVYTLPLEFNYFLEYFRSPQETNALGPHDLSLGTRANRMHAVTIFDSIMFRQRILHTFAFSNLDTSCDMQARRWNGSVQFLCSHNSRKKIIIKDFISGRVSEKTSHSIRLLAVGFRLSEISNSFFQCIQVTFLVKGITTTRHTPTHRFMTFPVNTKS